MAVASLAVLGRGNVLLDKVSIGGEHREVPPLPGKIDGTPGGLSKHGKFEGPFSPFPTSPNVPELTGGLNEGDISMTRLDAFHGDPAVFQPEMYKDVRSPFLFRVQIGISDDLVFSSAARTR